MTQSPNPQPPAPLNDRIADIVLKVIMTGGVAGGGIGAFWQLFKQSDIPKAIASAAIGLGIAYAAKMLQPVHKGNERRLEDTGKALDRAIDSGIAKVMGVDDRYLACQAADCELCSTEGMAKISGIFTPMLEQAYVDLEFDRNSLAPGWRGLDAEGTIDPTDFSATVDIWQILAKATRDPIYSQIAILAWGGYGKTTLLRHIAYRLGKKQQPSQVPSFVPVLLLLRKYRDLLSQDNPPDLPTLIETHHIPSLPDAAGLQMPANWARDLLKQGKAVVMLDGFDEVPKAQRPLVARWLNVQLRSYRKSVFILTARPKAYLEQGAADRLEFNTLLHVKKFKPEQTATFVHKWYWCQEYYHHGKQDTSAIRKVADDAAADLLSQIQQRQELADLATNPLLLGMIAMFHRRYPGAELPKRRADLYQEMCVLQLRDRPGARKLETLFSECDAQTILQMLALEMMQKGEERVEQDTLLARLATYLADQEETANALDFLSQIEQISELLVQREPEEFEFAHLSFQEFLAAKEILRLKQESLLHDHLRDDWWKQVILLYISLVKKPSQLIRTTLNQGATDLAYACWQETSKRLEPELVTDLDNLRQAVQTSRYAQLEDYLKNGQWKEADKETYRLMITTVGKDEGEWFEREELLNFPCEPLLAIDGLWVKYSNGHFGFSVQKEIYVKSGAKLDGKYPGNEIWETFCSSVGWYVNNEHIDYDHVTFDIYFLKGHLPVGGSGGCGLRGVVGWLAVGVSSLASRLVNCRTSQV